MDKWRNAFYNLGHNILAIYCILVQIWFTKSKTRLHIKYKKLVSESPHELPKDLKFRILGNKEILEKPEDGNLIRRRPTEILQI